MRHTYLAITVIASIATAGMLRADDARPVAAPSGTPAIPKKLTPETFDAIAARASLTPEDLAWQQVPCRDGFFEGVLEAQAADKPIFYWIYEGDPRGNC